MDADNGRSELEAPGPEGTVVFLDRNVLSHSQSVEVVGTTGWFQEDPSIANCVGTLYTFYNFDEAVVAQDQKTGYDLSVHHEENMIVSRNSRKRQMQVPSSTAKDQNMVVNLRMHMPNSMVSHNTEAGNVDQEEVLMPVQSSVTQKEEVSPLIGPSSRPLLEQVPVKKSRRKSNLEVNHLAYEYDAPGLEVRSEITPRKKRRISKVGKKPSNKKQKTSTVSPTPEVTFGDVSIASVPRPEPISQPEVTEVDDVAIETQESTRTPSGSRLKVVYIDIEVMEILSKEQKNWFADFSCTEPDPGTTSESPVKRRFAKTLKRARDVLCSKVWETVADSILVAEQIFGMRPIIKKSYWRPAGKPIVIRFISRSDELAESLATLESSTDIMLRPDDDKLIGPEARIPRENLPDDSSTLFGDAMWCTQWFPSVLTELSYSILENL